MKYVIIIVFGFLAQFVDAIAGGGGLISIPALMAAGLPAHYALGTNKFGAAFGTIASAYNFIKNNKVYKRLIAYWICFSVIGASIGSSMVNYIPESILNFLIATMLLIVTAYTVFKKGFGNTNAFTDIDSKVIAQGCIMALFFGFYDGFFGPGTGSFLIFTMIYLFKFDFLTASAHAKLLNLASCLSALTIFIIYRKVLFVEGSVLAVGMLCGGIVGSKLVIKNGVKLVKPIFIIVSISFIIKLIYQIL